MNTGKAQQQKSGKTYKDTFIKKLLRETERAIEVVNALEGTNYPKNANARIFGLENSLARRFNDSAIAIENLLIVLIEHQSTVNPNMPLRLLPNITEILYSWYVDMKKIYGTKLLKIPTPKFYVLYNGKDELESDTLKLSDAFMIEPGEFSLELKVRVMDVRYGSRSDILKKSPSLNGYAYLVSLIEN